MGTSRTGKTVRWKGAHAARYEMALAICSGEGGAALSRHDYGENLKHFTDTSRYFYQFANNSFQYPALIEPICFANDFTPILKAFKTKALRKYNYIS